MRVTYANNTLTVVTDIKETTIKKGIADLAARDEKGNELFRVHVSKDETCSIDANGMKVNVFTNGFAALVKVFPSNTTEADVQKQLGKHLVAAAKYTEIIAANADAEEATIAAIFTPAE